MLLAAVPCIFRPQSPANKNKCMHHTGNFGNFVSDLVFFCLLHPLHTLFLLILYNFCKKCSPPSVGSMILKAAQKRNHKKNAFRALQVGESQPLLHHLLLLNFCEFHRKNKHFLLVGPFGQPYFALFVVLHAFKVSLAHFCLAHVAILLKNAPRHRGPHRPNM